MKPEQLTHKYLKPTRTVKTRYVYVGKLKPRKFPTTEGQWDETDRVAGAIT